MPDVTFIFIDRMSGLITGKSNEPRKLNYACNGGQDISCQNCSEPWERCSIVDDLDGFDGVELTQPSDDPDGENFILIKSVRQCPACPRK